MISANEARISPQPNRKGTHTRAPYLQSAANPEGHAFTRAIKRRRKAATALPKASL
jgi:hypothetical protein